MGRLPGKSRHKPAASMDWHIIKICLPIFPYEYAQRALIFGHLWRSHQAVSFRRLVFRGSCISNAWE
jgi:hypothetical protein